MDEAELLEILPQVKEMEEKLAKLRGGVTLVRPEERKAIEKVYSEQISHWRKRKRIFKDLWDAITENSPKDLKEFKVLYCVAQRGSSCIWPCTKFALTAVLFLQEELGIEYDEDVGVSLQSFSDLSQHSKKRTRGQ